MIEVKPCLAAEMDFIVVKDHDTTRHHGNSYEYDKPYTQIHMDDSQLNSVLSESTQYIMLTRTQRVGRYFCFCKGRLFVEYVGNSLAQSVQNNHLFLS